jgi:hypothetical protein
MTRADRCSPVGRVRSQQRQTRRESPDQDRSWQQQPAEIQLARRNPTGRREGAAPDRGIRPTVVSRGVQNTPTESIRPIPAGSSMLWAFFVTKVISEIVVMRLTEFDTAGVRRVPADLPLPDEDGLGPGRAGMANGVSRPSHRGGELLIVSPPAELTHLEQALRLPPATGATGQRGGPESLAEGQRPGRPPRQRSAARAPGWPATTSNTAGR